jgi:hypothetical protein
MTTPTGPLDSAGAFATPRGRRARMTAPALWAVGMLAAVVVLHVRDPHESGSYAYCPWLLLTGTPCPGCGGLRAVHDLTNGELAAALSSNLLVVALIPVAVLLWAAWTRSRWRGRTFTTPLFSVPALASLLAVAIAFGVLRNVEATSWLAP